MAPHLFSPRTHVSRKLELQPRSWVINQALLWGVGTPNLGTASCTTPSPQDRFEAVPPLPLPATRHTQAEELRGSQQFPGVVGRCYGHPSSQAHLSEVASPSVSWSG